MEYDLFYAKIIIHSYDSIDNVKICIHFITKYNPMDKNLWSDSKEHLYDFYYLYNNLILRFYRLIVTDISLYNRYTPEIPNLRHLYSDMGLILGVFGFFP